MPNRGVMGLLAFVLALLFLPQGNSKPDAGVVARGDHAMGFSHETTDHHFRLNPHGGTIEVLAKDPSDLASRDQIRMHLSHIVRMFSAGNFKVPMFIHDTTPPGSETMSRLKGQIRYRLVETAHGAKIEIETKNAEAVSAVHEFLKFQISDHKTGDSTQN